MNDADKHNKLTIIFFEFKIWIIGGWTKAKAGQREKYKRCDLGKRIAQPNQTEASYDSHNRYVNERHTRT
jgi:hypothetical protein